MSSDRCGRDRKKKIKTELDAKIALAGRINKDKGEIRYYKCPFGSHYHLTSQPKRAAV